MPQVTIYFPDDLLEDVKSEAKRSHMSLSAYLANLARRSVRPRAWPAGFWELAGSCPDLEAPDDASPEPIAPL